MTDKSRARRLLVPAAVARVFNGVLLVGGFFIAAPEHFNWGPLALALSLFGM